MDLTGSCAGPGKKKLEVGAALTEKRVQEMQQGGETFVNLWVGFRRVAARSKPLQRMQMRNGDCVVCLPTLLQVRHYSP